MRKRAIWIFVLLWTLTACVPAQESSPDLEPALTAVLESKPTTTPALKPAPTATAEPEPTETVIIEQRQADSADSAERDKSEVMPADVVLIFHRSGGFAGLDEQWTVYTDGQIELPDGTQKQVDASQIQTLLATIEAAKFFDLNESYVPLDACCDRFTYSITVRQGDQVHRVMTIDDAPKTPVELQEVLGQINDFLNNLGPVKE